MVSLTDFQLQVKLIFERCVRLSALFIICIFKPMKHVIAFIVPNEFIICVTVTKVIKWLRILKCIIYVIRKVWRFQRGNQKQNIVGQTTQWAKEKTQNNKRSIKHYPENERLSNMNPLKPMVKSDASEWWAVPAPHVALVKLLLLHTQRTRLWLLQTEHIRGYLWHRYSVTVNPVMMTTVIISKLWLQLNH